MKENHLFQNQVVKDGFSKTVFLQTSRIPGNAGPVYDADGDGMDNNPLYHGQAGTARGSHILSPRPVYQRWGGGIHFLQDIFTSVTRYVKYKDKGIPMLGYILFSISLHMLTRILIWYLKCMLFVC